MLTVLSPQPIYTTPQAALFTPTVRVPSAYFGLGGKPGDCLEFPAAMQTFNKFEQYMVSFVCKFCACVREIEWMGKLLSN
jgi:hypothetical protein